MSELNSEFTDLTTDEGKDAADAARPVFVMTPAKQGVAFNAPLSVRCPPIDSPKWPRPRANFELIDKTTEIAPGTP